MAGPKLREVQNAVDEAEQVPLVHLDALEIHLLLPDDTAPHPERHELRVAADSVKRRAELVRHHGDEVCLRLVRALRLRARRVRAPAGPL